MTLLILVLTGASASARTIQAGVTHESYQTGEKDAEIKMQTPQIDSTVLNGGTEKIEKPSWIQGNVFSTESMTMYSFWQIGPFKKEFRWAIPTNHPTTVKFRQAVVDQWKGYKPDGSCDVTCVPLDQPGRFKFHHKRPDGPHGYLERIGETKNGFPRYRIWFDE